MPECDLQCRSDPRAVVLFHQQWTGTWGRGAAARGWYVLLGNIDTGEHQVHLRHTHSTLTTIPVTVRINMFLVCFDKIHQHDNHWLINYILDISHFIFRKLFHYLFFRNIAKTCWYGYAFFNGNATSMVQVHTVLSCIDMPKSTHPPVTAGCGAPWRPHVHEQTPL